MNTFTNDISSLLNALMKFDFWSATPLSLFTVFGVLAIYAMVIARLVKIKIQPNVALVVPEVLLFAAYHVHFWVTPHKYANLDCTYVACSVGTLAFLFGTSMICAGVMKMCNGELCIKSNHGLIKFVKNLPIKITFEGKSLCSISWLAAVLLIIVPVVASIFAVVVSIISLIICFFTGQNPYKMVAEIMELDGWPYPEMQRTKSGHFKGPGLYVLALTVLWLLGWGIIALITQKDFLTGLLNVLRIIFEIVAVYVSVALASMGIGALVGKFGKPTDEVAEAMTWLDEDSRKEPLAYVTAPFGVINLFWQVFRQKFCPKIRYVTTPEYDATSDDNHQPDTDCG